MSNKPAAGQERERAHKIAVVTGASSGIGRSLALVLQAKGYEPLLIARRKDKLAEVADDVKAAGGTAHTLVIDICEKGAAARVLAFAEKLGEVEILVNNAGRGDYGKFVELDAEAQLGSLDLNVRSLVEACAVFLPGMIARKKGYIMNVGSTAGFQPIPYHAVYAATKAFVLSFTEALAVELKGTGVKASCLCPGPTQTEFLELAEYSKKGMVVPKLALMTADRVAQIGVKGMLRGKPVVIAGLSNAAGAFASRLAPRSVVAAISGMVFKPRPA